MIVAERHHPPVSLSVLAPVEPSPKPYPMHSKVLNIRVPWIRLRRGPSRAFGTRTEPKLRALRHSFLASLAFIGSGTKLEDVSSAGLAARMLPRMAFRAYMPLAKSHRRGPVRLMR